MSGPSLAYEAHEDEFSFPWHLFILIYIEREILISADSHQCNRKKIFFNTHIFFITNIKRQWSTYNCWGTGNCLLNVQVLIGSDFPFRFSSYSPFSALLSSFHHACTHVGHCEPEEIDLYIFQEISIAFWRVRVWQLSVTERRIEIPVWIDGAETEPFSWMF